MSGHVTAKSTIRWSVLLWVLLIALVVLIIGIWAELSWGMTIGMMAIPVAAGLLLAALGGRRTQAPDDVYGIASQGARSEGRLTIALPVSRVPRAVEDATQGKLPLSLVSLSETGAELSRGVTLKTWGERITLEFRPIAPEQTEITARCEPKLGTTMVDYGQGAQDLRLLLGAIEEQVHQIKR